MIIGYLDPQGKCKMATAHPHLAADTKRHKQVYNNEDPKIHQSALR